MPASHALVRRAPSARPRSGPTALALRALALVAALTAGSLPAVAGEIGAEVGLRGTMAGSPDEATSIGVNPVPRKASMAGAAMREGATDPQVSIAPEPRPMPVPATDMIETRSLGDALDDAVLRQAPNAVEQPEDGSSLAGLGDAVGTMTDDAATEPMPEQKRVVEDITALTGPRRAPDYVPHIPQSSPSLAIYGRATDPATGRSSLATFQRR